MGPSAITAITMRFDVSHRSTYKYILPVVQSRHLLHLLPRSTPAQTLIHHSLLINPAPAVQTQIVDFFGNSAVLLRIDDEHEELIVHARSAVDVAAPLPVDLSASAAWEDVVDLCARSVPPCTIDVVQFTCPSRHTPVDSKIAAFAHSLFSPRLPVLEAAMTLTRHMFEEFSFDPAATDISTPVQKVLETKRGVCQDFAHLAIAALRSLRLPARYVSGYLLTRPPPGEVKLKGADASHAWISVWAPGSGWVDFDPTNGIIPSGEHITIGWGRDYEDICPIGGVLLGGGDQTMSVSVDVEPTA